MKYSKEFKSKWRKDIWRNACDKYDMIIVNNQLKPNNKYKGFIQKCFHWAYWQVKI